MNSMDIKNKFEEMKIDIKLSDDELSKAKQAQAIWTLEIGYYGTGLGVLCYIYFHSEIEHAIGNIAPIGDEASKVIIKTHS